MILTSTIDKSKGALFSVCNKIIVQLCAKIGGEPWAINELPYFYESSMCIGYHVN
jgi:aubergine-like protein